jgi:hypothetical protein
VFHTDRSHTEDNQHRVVKGIFESTRDGRRAILERMQTCTAHHIFKIKFNFFGFVYLEYVKNQKMH